MRWFYGAVAVVLATVSAWAQVPRVLSYQGILTDRDGRILPDGDYELQIRLYDRLDATEPIYSERQRVTSQHGVVNVLIGTVEPLPERLTFDRVYYVGVSVNGSAELQPRTMLTAVPYALRAESAATADVARTLAPEALKGVSVQTTPSGPAGGDLSGSYPNPTIGGGRVTTPKLAYAAVTTEKIAPRAVTGNRINQMGATHGQVLTWVTGSTNDWMPTDVSAWAWALTGNSGTNPTTNFLGTTDAQPLVIRTNNVERLRVTVGGNVGIGTTTPSQRLDVAGNVRFSGALMPAGNAGASGDVLVSQGAGTAPVWQSVSSLVNAWFLNGNSIASAWNGSNGNFLGTTNAQPLVIATTNTTTPQPIQFWTNNVERLRITDGGDVLPGTDNAYDLGSPSQRWQDIYGVNINGTVGNFTTLTLSGLTPGSVIFAGTGGTLSQDNGNFYWDDVNNRLGIGTSSPAATLDVVGTAQVSGNASVGGNLTVSGATVLLPNILGGSAATDVLVWNGGNVEYRSANSLGWLLGGNNLTSVQTLGTQSNHDLPIITNNTERMRITAAGDVGIGTSAPGARLHVENGEIWLFNNGNNTRFVIGDNPGPGQYGWLQWDSNLDLLRLDHSSTPGDGLKLKGNFVSIGNLPVNEPLKVGLGMIEFMRVTTTGNVGIGTTSPSERLDVSDGNIAITNTDGTARQLRLYEPFDGTNNYTAFRAQTQTSDITYTLPASLTTTNTLATGILQTDASGNLSWVDPSALAAATAWALTGNAITGTEFLGTTNAQPLVIRTNNTERMRITAAGDVGIGTSAPAATLDVVGTAQVSGNTSVGGNLSVGGNGSVTGNLTVSGATVSLPNIPNNSTATNVLVLNGGNVEYRSANSLVATTGWLLGGNNLTSVQTLGTQSNHDLPIITNNTERMRITAAGDVGIGTSSPGARLHVENGEIWLFNNGNNTRFVIGDNPAPGQYGWLQWDSNLGLLRIDHSSTPGNGLKLKGNFVSIGNLPVNEPLKVGLGMIEFMRVTTTGNVGIGTTSPSERLDVSDGNIAITNTDGTARQLRLYEPFDGTNNYTAFRAQTQTSDITYTLPASLTTTNTLATGILQTDASGNLSWVNPSALGGGAGWALTGNSITSAWNGSSGNFLGTTNAQPLVIATTNTTTPQPIQVWVGNQETFRFNPPGSSAPAWSIQRGGGNTRGFHAVDLQSARSAGTQVASGDYSVIGGGRNNTASYFYATVGGGYQNTASYYFATVGGGAENTASVDAATVGGGRFNNAGGYAATVGGGWQNGASGNYSTVGGGGNNTASGNSATVGGGGFNTASGNGATVGGGSTNTASGDFSAIPGGSYLKVGTRSFGYSGQTSTTQTDLSANSNIAAFVDVDLWLYSRDRAQASQLRLYEAQAHSNGQNYVALRAPTSLSANTTYTLPASAPATSAAWLQSDNTGTMSWRPVLYGTVSVDPPLINATTSATFTVTITGVQTGDLVFLTPPSTLEATLIFQGANVTAANTVTILMRNVGGAVNGLARTWSYMVIRP